MNFGESTKHIKKPNFSIDPMELLIYTRISSLDIICYNFHNERASLAKGGNDARDHAVVSAAVHPRMRAARLGAPRQRKWRGSGC
jgi:hypothetical protein